MKYEPRKVYGDRVIDEGKIRISLSPRKMADINGINGDQSSLDCTLKIILRRLIWISNVAIISRNDKNVRYVCTKVQVVFYGALRVLAPLRGGNVVCIISTWRKAPLYDAVRS